ncbi:alpha/beta hydrolase [Sphingomonas sp. DBB INV C78]|uniref:alpha/beta fold hydrolase n=1 Tax=Sphingomonas sp. DBB INV C78 TaxID=3349434 RepID=UPI0036D22E24
MTTRIVRAGVLDIAYREIGPSDGWPVILVHGFPYDALCYAGTASLLAASGARVITPWMRGFGETGFVSAYTLRSGQQAAFGADLLCFMDALHIDRAILGGFDWGGRAACVVAAIWPERVHALVSAMGYNILRENMAELADTPENELRRWYIWYFLSPRGPKGLARHRQEFCQRLWSAWSPNWKYDQGAFDASAQAFDNPDFVEVVIHSYRHRFGMVGGDPAYAEMERVLGQRPPIHVPTVAIDGDSDGVMPVGYRADLASHFRGPREYRLLAGVGHNPPQEDPKGFAEAVLAARRLAAVASG